MFYIPGNEVINFQAKSNLGKRLSALFQEVIDYRDSLVYESDNKAQQRAERVAAVCTYFNKVTVPEFKKIVLQEVGLTINKVYSFGGLDRGITCSFAVDTGFDDDYASLAMQNRETGISSILPEESVKNLEKLADMSKDLDLETGMFKTGKFNDGKRTISANIYFDVNCAFLVSDFLPTGAERFTAKEVAAIMMHEIGHVVTIAERMRAMYYCRDRAETYKANFDKLSFTDKRTALIDLADKAIQDLQQIKKRKSGVAGVDKYINNLADASLKTVTSIKKVTQSIPEEGISDVIIGIASFVLNILALIGVFIFFIGRPVVLFGLCFVVDLMYILNDLTHKEKMRDRDTKTSDSFVTGMNDKYLERWADEFVSRQGYGADLVSGLHKIHDYIKFISGDGQCDSTALRQSTLFSLLCKMVGTIWTNLIGCFDVIFNYEDEYARAVRVRQNTYAFFKNADIPGEIAEMWLSSVDKMNSEIAKIKDFRDTDLFKAIWHVKQLMTDRDQFFAIIRDANLSRDYERLQNNLDSLYNNPLFYQAAKLKYKAR